jgi:putative sterol carrier protein
MAFTTVAEVLEQIGNVDPAQLQGLEAVVLFDLSGEGGGKWTAKMAGGKVDFEEGEAASSNVALSMDAQDFIALANGELNAVSAFMQGKIKVSGDMAVAMRLQSILTA